MTTVRKKKLGSRSEVSLVYYGTSKAWNCWKMDTYIKYYYCLLFCWEKWYMKQVIRYEWNHLRFLGYISWWNYINGQEDCRVAIGLALKISCYSIKHSKMHTCNPRWKTEKTIKEIARNNFNAMKCAF